MGSTNFALVREKLIPKFRIKIQENNNHLNNCQP